MEEAYPTRDDVRFGEVDRPSQGSDHFGIGDVVGIQQKDEIRISASNARISRSAKIAIALAKQSKIQGSIPLFGAVLSIPAWTAGNILVLAIFAVASCFLVAHVYALN